MPKKLPFAMRPGKAGVYHAETGNYVAVLDDETLTRAQSARLARLIAASEQMADFVQSYLDMADEVTAKGAKARPTVAQLNKLLEQAREIERQLAAPLSRRKGSAGI